MTARRIVLLLFVVTVALLATSSAGADSTRHTRAPLWSENGSFLYVTTDKWCHETNCDGYGVRAGGQDVVLFQSNWQDATNTRVMTTTSSGHYGIITKIWTEDGWSKALGSDWVYSNHGYGNGYDLYVGQHSSLGAAIFRFAHMKTDGSWFRWQGRYIYSLYDTGNKLSWSQVMGKMGATGYVSAAHLHWELIIGSSRYEPTYSYLDNIGATYYQAPTLVDSFSYSCYVTASNNCTPGVAPLRAATSGTARASLGGTGSRSMAARYGYALDSGLPSVEQIPNYGADAVPILQAPSDLEVPSGTKTTTRRFRPLPPDEVVRLTDSGETVLASDLRRTR